MTTAKMDDVVASGEMVRHVSGESSEHSSEVAAAAMGLSLAALNLQKATEIALQISNSIEMVQSWLYNLQYYLYHINYKLISHTRLFILFQPL